MTSYLRNDASTDQDARRVASDLAAVYAARGTQSPTTERARHFLRRLTHRA